MALDKPTASSQLHELTDDQAITLRRVAFGESVARALRPADIQRLCELRLITVVGSEMALTTAGRTHMASLPRALFATKSVR